VAGNNGKNKLTLVGIDPDGLVRVAAEGNLSGADTRATGANLLESLLGANWASGRVALDLGRAAVIDSATIGWLIESHKHFKARGGTLLLHSLSPRVRQMLELLKLDQMLFLLNNESAARNFLRGRGVAAQAAPGNSRTATLSPAAVELETCP
jgi:anti-anti-sigma factor